MGKGDYYKATELKQERIGRRTGELTNRKEYVWGCVYISLTNYRVNMKGKINEEENKKLFNKWSWKNWLSIRKKENRIQIKISIPDGIRTLNIKSKTSKLFEETVGKYFSDSGRDKNFLK